MVEFVCDGHCGASRQTNTDVTPTGWVVVVMDVAALTTTRHFCSECWSVMAVGLWNQERQRRILGVLTDEELADFDLQDLRARHEKASGPYAGAPASRRTGEPGR